MINIQKITFSYDKNTPVFDGVTLNIQKGEFLGILGPNGSGKSTLLKLISGTITPSSGKIFVEGRNLREIAHKERARRIAVVPQESQIPFSFSALEVVLMGRAPYLPLLGFESETDIELAKRAMKETDTLQFADRDIHDLSGGERQRVIVARSLAQGPSILLLDEPTTFLDIRHQVELSNLVKRKNKEDGLTVITVVHDINIASTFCDRILFLKDGEIVVDGTPDKVVTYANVKSVFNAEVYVGINDLTGKPYYVPFS